MSDSSSPKNQKNELLARLRNSSFPPAAVAGALVSFVASAKGSPEKAGAKASSDAGMVQISLSPKVPVHYELEYKPSMTIGPSVFRRSISGLAVGPGDRIFVLGDGEVHVFEPDGSTGGKWKIAEHASCIALSRDGQVYVGVAGSVEVFDSTGNRKQEFDAGEPGRKAIVTSIKVLDKEILVADAAARIIRRFGLDGKRLGEIGNQGTARGFMLPNRYLDFDVSSKGVVVVADPGRHRVTSWSKEGAPLGHFGKFGLISPEDFVGCCNPVNLAFANGGRIVAAEKVAARVKVYSAEGKLLALIGPEHFDPKFTHLHLAVDSKGRILVGDPVRLEIKAFSAVGKSGGGEGV